MCKQIFVPLILGAAFLCSSCVKSTVPKETKAQVVNIETYTAELEATPVPFVTEIPEAGSQKMSENDIRLIALVTMAEAEGECEEGQRLVIDTILNRVDSVYFPDTVYNVVYQPYHFSSMWNGRAERCEVREEICQLVKEELELRTNYNVTLFAAGSYHIYGVPMFQVGNHYFSSYE